MNIIEAISYLVLGLLFVFIVCMVIRNYLGCLPLQCDECLELFDEKENTFDNGFGKKIVICKHCKCVYSEKPSE